MAMPADPLPRIVMALDSVRSPLISVHAVTGRIETTHSWALEGIDRTPPTDIVQSNPWALSCARAGRPVVFARLDELPAQAAVDKSTFARMGLKSHVGMPMWVGGRLRFSGEASASPEREAALANLLNIIGRRQGSRSVIQIG